MAAATANAQQLFINAQAAAQRAVLPTFFYVFEVVVSVKVYTLAQCLKVILLFENYVLNIIWAKHMAKQF